MDNTPKPEFSRPVAVAALERAPARLEPIVADENERMALARRFDVPAVRALSARAEIAPWGPGGWRVWGIADAGFTQTCVVTLEPVDTAISEPFVRFFAPAARMAEAAELLGPHSGDALDALPESIDIGEIASETAALAIDPYPRRPQASFDGLVQGPPGVEPLTDEALRPFARLAALRTGRDRE